MNFFLTIGGVPISEFLMTEHSECFCDFFFFLTYGKTLDIQRSHQEKCSEIKQNSLFCVCGPYSILKKAFCLLEETSLWKNGKVFQFLKDLDLLSVEIIFLVCNFT